MKFAKLVIAAVALTGASISFADPVCPHKLNYSMIMNTVPKRIAASQRPATPQNEPQTQRVRATK